jgi:hypothetical protein
MARMSNALDITISGDQVRISNAPADAHRFVQMPRLYMTDAQFIDGFHKGLGNFMGVLVAKL